MRWLVSTCRHMCNALQQAFESLWSHAGLLPEQEPTSNERSVEHSQKRKASVAPPSREREGSPPARQPPPGAGEAGMHAPHRTTSMFLTALASLDLMLAGLHMVGASPSIAMVSYGIWMAKQGGKHQSGCAGNAAYHAGPHRPGQRGRSGIRVRLPTPPLEDLSELVNFDEPDIAYEELAQVWARNGLV